MRTSYGREKRAWSVVALLGLAVSAARAQTPSPAPAEEGIPVTSKLVIEKCSGCHRQDPKGNLTRISWERTTPEGWELAIKRMIRLNDVAVTPGEAREIVQYLAANHGLAPEEAKAALYEAERRLQDEKAPN